MQHLVTSALLASILIAPFAVTETAAAAEAPAATQPRIVIELDDAGVARILSEMRGMLIAVRKIVEGLSDADMKAVADGARAAGMQAMADADPKLRAQLPADFKQLALATHGDFDTIAADAEKFNDTRRTLAQLGLTLQKCIACHAVYQVKAR